jgi:hypothetical protein
MAVNPKTKREHGRHVGLQLAPEVGKQLDELMKLEQERVGESARVTTTMYVENLIRSEYRRKLGKKS